MADETGTEDRAGEAVAHLQAAVRELVAASRAFLDVVEEVVEDPAAGDALLATFSDLSRRVTRRDDRPADGGVEHIDLD